MAKPIWLVLAMALTACAANSSSDQVAPVAPELPADLAALWAVCESRTASEARIVACTRLIGSGDLDFVALASAYNNRGVGHVYLDRFGKALDDFSEAIQLLPDNALILRNRGALFVDTDRYREALSDLNQSISLDPSDAKAFSIRGEAYFGLGDYRLALSDLDEAIRLDPDYGAAYANRARAHMSLGNLEQAWLDAEHARRLDPRLANTLPDV